MSEHERVIQIFGTEVRLLVGKPVDSGLLPSSLAAAGIEAMLRAVHRRLTRFESDSELSRLNDSLSTEITVSPILARSVQAAVWAAQFSGGLVDPTVIGMLEKGGYAHSLVGVSRASLADALKRHSETKPARPSSDSRWRYIQVNGSKVVRPPGVRVDLGGVVKGLVADLIALRLSRYRSFVADMGGDIRLGGVDGPRREVLVESPFTGEAIAALEVRDGSVATSGIGSRIWHMTDRFGHHMIDPSSGTPAWTGVVQATAVDQSALKAEVTAKMALLSGVQRAREILREAGGGILVLNDRSVETVAGASVVPRRLEERVAA